MQLITLCHVQNHWTSFRTIWVQLRTWIFVGEVNYVLVLSKVMWVYWLLRDMEVVGEWFFFWVIFHDVRLGFETHSLQEAQYHQAHVSWTWHNYCCNCWSYQSSYYGRQYTTIVTNKSISAINVLGCHLCK